MKTSINPLLYRILAVLSVIVGMPQYVSANVFNVTQTSDGNDPTQLRGAILAANAVGGGPHTINVPAGTYNLTLGTIEFGNNAQDISILGAGAGSTVINMTATMPGRIFFINTAGDVSGVVTTISGIKFTGGENSDDFGGGAIICGGPGNVTNITNCVFEGNVDKAKGGGALSMSGGGTLNVDNCTFHDNKVLSANDNGSGGAILIGYYVSSVTSTGTASITNCTFTNNLASSTYFTSGGAIGLNTTFSASSPSFYTKIEKNKFFDNATGMASNSEGGAISILSSFTVDVNYNAFTGNKLGNSVNEALSIRKSQNGVVNATNNWWGCSTDPQAVGTCSEGARVIDGLGSATLTTAPWLVLKPAAGSAALCLPSSSQTTVTASFLNNSAGTAIALSNLSGLIGVPVSFSAVNGSISGAQASIQADGKAIATYTGSSEGDGSANVMAGYMTNADLTGRVAIATGASPTITTPPEKVTTCPGAVSAVFSIAASSSTSLSYQWYLGDTPLSNSGKYGGVTTATLTVHNIVAGDHDGQFSVKITNACGDTFSNSVELNVLTGRLYVAEGASGDGSGWGDALGDLSDALNIAAGCSGITEIWVKAGTYIPSGQPYNLNLGGTRHNAFYLINNVSVYGGFAGNETELSARNPGLNQTILSGNIGAAADADNSYHTIVAVNTDAAARLDGFIIRDGNADGTGVSSNISGTAVGASAGGGIALYSASPRIINCVFTANKAGQGGAIFVFGDGAAPFISDCVVSDNLGIDNGGGILNGFSSGATIQHCTISRNASTGEGAGVFNMLSHPLIVNTVIWGNSGLAPTGISDLIATPVVSYSLVQDGHIGTGNLNTDALFANQSDPDGADNRWMTADDGLRLSACSPAVNAGFYSNNVPSTDIPGSPRVFDVTADMGAYELHNYRDGSSLSVDGDAVSQTIVGGTTNGFLAPGCRVIAQVTGAGAEPVSGSVQAKAFVEAGLISAGVVQFVQRHYEILPANNAASATAKIKLFFLQSEFDLFNNSVAGVKLPTAPEDGTGKANLLVVQYHGTSATGQPGSYSGSTTTINPDDNDISWNGDLNRWEVTFEVTGFSGFFISNADPLPLKLVSFTANARENSTVLEWLTAEEENTSHFEIHRSHNAREWQTMPETYQAIGSGGKRYHATDFTPLDGLNYYRLKMIDLDRTFSMSQIAVVEHRLGYGLNVYPNPVSTFLHVEQTGPAAVSGDVELVNSAGNVVLKRHFDNGRATIRIDKLPKGIYFLHMKSGVTFKVRKIAIE